VRGFNTGCSKHNHLGIHFHFFSCRPVDIRDASRHAVLIHEYAAYESVREQREILGGFGVWDGKPGGGEESSDVAAAATVPA